MPGGGRGLLQSICDQRFFNIFFFVDDYFSSRGNANSPCGLDLPLGDAGLPTTVYRLHSTLA